MTGSKKDEITLLKKRVGYLERKIKTIRFSPSGMVILPVLREIKTTKKGRKA